MPGLFHVIDNGTQGILTLIVCGTAGVVHINTIDIFLVEFVSYPNGFFPLIVNAFTFLHFLVIGIVEVTKLLFFTSGIAPPFHFIHINIVTRSFNRKIFILTCILGSNRVDLNQRWEVFALQNHLFNRECRCDIRLVFDGQTDGTQHRGHFQIGTHHVFTLCASHNTAVTNKELVVSISFFPVTAILFLFADAVYSLTVTHVVCERRGEEVVTFQHLGVGFPSAILLAFERIVRAYIVYEAVSFRPRLFGPFLQVFEGTLRSLVILIGAHAASHLVHQQGADLVTGFPLVTGLVAIIETSVGTIA